MYKLNLLEFKDETFSAVCVCVCKYSKFNCYFNKCRIQFFSRIPILCRELFYFLFTMALQNTCIPTIYLPSILKSHNQLY